LTGDVVGSFSGVLVGASVEGLLLGIKVGCLELGVLVGQPLGVLVVGRGVLFQALGLVEGREDEDRTGLDVACGRRDGASERRVGIIVIASVTAEAAALNSFSSGVGRDDGWVTAGVGTAVESGLAPSNEGPLVRAPPAEPLSTFGGRPSERLGDEESFVGLSVLGARLAGICEAGS